MTFFNQISSIYIYILYLQPKLTSHKEKAFNKVYMYILYTLTVDEKIMLKHEIMPKHSRRTGKVSSTLVVLSLKDRYFFCELIHTTVSRDS